MTDKERLEEIKQDVKMTRKDLAVSPSNEMTLHMDILLDSMDYLIGRVQELERFKEYFDELYGRGLEIAEWHLNGGLEPFDNFYEDAINYMEREGLFMTDKERYGFDVEREMRHLKGIVEKNDTLTISNRFTRYLIEQAERVQELEDIIYQDERQGMIEDLYEENKRYREALELLNRVSALDMKDEQVTSSHFVLDITGDALENRNE